jgi:Domain of unknown function (DUF1842)
MPTATADLKIQAPETNVVEHVQVHIGGDKPGAPDFRLNLIINGTVVTGVGRISQTTNPPLDIRTYLSGRTSLIVFGSEVTRIIQLTGHEFPTLTPPNPINVRETDIVLNGVEGTKGHGNYQYLHNGQLQKVDGPATAAWSKAPI